LRVYVNGVSREVQGNPSLAELITQLDLPAARIAVEVNREVVRRGEWGNTMLRDEDRIEIVHFVGGGFVPFCGSDNI
jgi:thiamine biosynthesis protein ThiS